MGEQPSLGAGNFYGNIQTKREQCGAIFTDLRHPVPKRLPLHSHELPFFELLLAGNYGESFGHQAKQFRPFTMLFRPAGIPHQDEIGPTGVRLFEIEVRPSWSKRLAECAAKLETGCDDCAGGELFWLGMKLFCELRGCADDLVVESNLAELLFCAGQGHEEAEDGSPWLRRTIDKLQSEYPERLTLDDLSAEAGVHPVHLSRVFRKRMGSGIGDYIRRLRVRSACEHMLDPEIPMAEIGIAVGFADQSHFTRSFRKITGMTPAKFRSLVAAGEKQPPIP